MPTGLFRGMFQARPCQHCNVRNVPMQPAAGSEDANVQREEGRPEKVLAAALNCTLEIALLSASAGGSTMDTD
eukprot:1158976-Pelagomonas_calceolata.AAC.1